MPVFDVPTSGEPVHIEIESGASLVLLGANGAGKTRLGVWIENALGERVHRVGAHRSLVMNTKIKAPSFSVAERRLFHGGDDSVIDHRVSQRWSRKPATALLTDFDHVLAAIVRG